MKNIIIGAFAISLMPGLAFGVTDDESAVMKAMQLIARYDDSRSGLEMHAAGGDPRGSWPSGHSTNAQHEIITYFDEEFDFYVWRANGYVWVEADPLDLAFICSSSFTIVQGGQLFDDVKIEKYAGGSQCGDISDGTVYLLTQYEFSDTADLDEAFALFHDGDDVVQINVAALSGSGISTPSPQYGTATQALDIYLPTIQYNSPKGLKYIWADLELYGQTPGGDILFKLNGYGVTP